MICETDGRPVNGQGGYQRHRRRGETPCDPCRRAKNHHSRRMLEALRADPEYRERELAERRQRYSADAEYRDRILRARRRRYRAMRKLRLAARDEEAP